MRWRQFGFARTSSLVLMLGVPGFAAENGVVASWSFNEGPGAVTPEAISRNQDVVRGYHKFVPGVSGSALRFDGQTTSVIHGGSNGLRLGDAFSVEAWVAIQAYPWTWCAIVDQENADRGFSFGIDPEGRFGIHLAVGGKWRDASSELKLPLYKWNHLIGAYAADSGITLYWNGKPVGVQKTSGKPIYAEALDVLIGRNHRSRTLSGDIAVSQPVAFSFDGIVDEVKIYNRALSANEALDLYAKVQPSGPPPLGPPKLPSGPKGPGRFGAYYTRLRYSEEWENPWRVGNDADVLVRFDEGAYRFISWRGTSYIPAWVTENGIWYTNEFFETSSSGMDGSAEPMADKQARFSQVRILESNEARVVLLWRYAPVGVNYDLVHTDELTGWSDWVEEYYTIYPDATGTRKIKIWSSNPKVRRGTGAGTEGSRQVQESIVINPAGTRAEDNITIEALTLANMRGESHTYSWADGPPGKFAQLDPRTIELLNRICDLHPEKHKWLTEPVAANIQVVNLKATYRPFVIVNPTGAAIDVYAAGVDRTRSVFNAYNHWPLSQQIRSHGRLAVATDRVSHTSLSHFQSWLPLEETEDTVSMLMLHGLTDKAARELVPLAKSWLSAPEIEMAGKGFASEGYDPAQRAYIVARQDAAVSAGVKLTLRASAERPAVNPVIIIRNWGQQGLTLRINERVVPLGKDFRVGRRHTLEGTDAVLWIRKESMTPLRMSVTSSRFN